MLRHGHGHVLLATFYPLQRDLTVIEA